MRKSRSTTILYSILGTGVALAFLGHGILGAKGQESFVELVTGTWDQLFGATISVGTATDLVNVIGWVDIVLAVVFFGLVAAAVAGKQIAYSKVAMGLFGWAALWGLVTAASRFTAEMNGAETWDVVERGPNYLLPAGLVYMIYAIGKHSEAVEARQEVVGSAITVDGRRERELAGSR